MFVPIATVTTSRLTHQRCPSAAIVKMEVGHRIRNSGPAMYPQHRCASPAAIICTTGITIPAMQKERTILDRIMDARRSGGKDRFGPKSGPSHVGPSRLRHAAPEQELQPGTDGHAPLDEIGRASCRE